MYKVIEFALKLVWAVFISLFIALFVTKLIIFEPVAYIFRGERKALRITAAVAFSLLALLIVMNPYVLFILAGVILFVTVLMHILVAKKEKFSSNDEYSGERKTTYSRDGIFSGLTLEEAKKKYRSLMKQYHPDNMGGDLEKSKEISLAYHEFVCSYKG